MRLNKVINAVLILKDKLKHIWTYRSRTWAEKALQEWEALARAVNRPDVAKFVKSLCRYRYGILNHCDLPIHNGKLEGVNNKIKVRYPLMIGQFGDQFIRLAPKWRRGICLPFNRSSPDWYKPEIGQHLLSFSSSLKTKYATSRMQTSFTSVRFRYDI